MCLHGGDGKDEGEGRQEGDGDGESDGEGNCEGGGEDEGKGKGDDDLIMVGVIIRVMVRQGQGQEET